MRRIGIGGVIVSVAQAHSLAFREVMVNLGHGLIAAGPRRTGIVNDAADAVSRLRRVGIERQDLLHRRIQRVSVKVIRAGAA